MAGQHMWSEPGPVQRDAEGDYRVETCERPGCHLARLVSATPSRERLGYAVVSGGRVAYRVRLLLKRPGRCAGGKTETGARKSARRCKR